MAERVVDLLEAVEIEQQQRQRIARARRGAQRLRQAVVEQHAVGQAGQRIVHRLMAQPALLQLGERDVAHDSDQQPLVLDHGRAQRQLDRKGRAVPAPCLALEPVAAARPRLERAVARELGEQLQHVVADQLVGMAAEHQGGGIVGGLDAAVGTHREDAVEALLDDVAHQRVELPQLTAVGERELGLSAIDDACELRAISGEQGSGLTTGRAQHHDDVDALAAVASICEGNGSALGNC
jgi:hypothetical protein